MIVSRQTALILEARALAFEAHAGHNRLNKAQQPYVYHLEEVARLVELSGGDEYEIASAWLHDAVEDTSVTLQEVHRRFGAEVGDTVHGLTDPPHFSRLSSLERKTKQAQRVRSESGRVKRVKLSDQTSNARCIARDPPVSWSRRGRFNYVQGARLIAIECAGVSEYLDDLFKIAYIEALKTLA
jgi:guanosine-3',5'-bis(diphosphate) 3'-pyrophosphohydrolase